MRLGREVIDSFEILNASLTSTVTYIKRLFLIYSAIIVNAVFDKSVI